MSDPARILSDLEAAGVHVTLEDGRLKVTGPQQAITARLDEIRAHKPELVELLTQAANDLEARLIEGSEALAKIQPDQTRHHFWLIRAEHEVFSMWFCPPKTRAEVLARYPGAEVEVLEDVVKMGLADWPDDQATEPDSGSETTAKAVCDRCAYWTPDRINPPGGLGHCAITAPASKRPGSLWPWPDAAIHCARFQEITAPNYA